MARRPATSWKGSRPERPRLGPIPGAHTIWEIVLHLTAWTREVDRRVLGGEPRFPEEGDWPAHPGTPAAPTAGRRRVVPGRTRRPPRRPDRGSRAEALADLAAAQASLIAALDDFPEQTAWTRWSVSPSGIYR